MRILVVHQGDRSGSAVYAGWLERDLNRAGLTASRVDAAEWMPRQTGKPVDRDVSARLRHEAQGFDLVHAVGYRPAYACGEAFRGWGRSQRWLASLMAMPRTLHPELTGRLSRAAALLCPTKAIRAELDSAFVSRTRLLRPGVELSDPAKSSRDAAREKLGLEPEVPVAIAAGRLLAERDLDQLVVSMDRVWFRLPDAELLIAGEGPDLPRLRETIDASRHPEKVRLLGWIDDLSSALVAADVVVVPGSERGFSLLALEAMAAGRATVAADSAGMAEVIDNRSTGVLWDEEDDPGDVIAQMLQAGAWLETMAERARERATNRYRREDSIERLIETYEELLGKPVR